mgnify:CR=1 FL=1
MSAIRKLRQQQLKSVAKQAGGAVSESDEDEVDAVGTEPEVVRKSAPNPFDFLDEDDEDVNEADDDGGDNTQAGMDRTDGPSKPTSGVRSKQSGKKSKKSNRKKNKPASKAIADENPAAGSATTTAASVSAEAVENELSRIMADLDSTVSAGPGDSAAASIVGNADEKKDAAGVSLLKTQPVFFNPDVEVRRVFGRAVLQIAREEDENKQQRNAHSRSNWKRTKLVKAEDSYPVSRDLEMVFEGAAGGASKFRFQYSRDSLVSLLHVALRIDIV